MAESSSESGQRFVSTDGVYFTRNGKRFFPIGINYLPSYLCGNHFEDYRPDHINADLDHIKDIGLDCVRVAVFWRSFEPKQGQFSAAFLDTFKTFVAECKDRDILVIPVFLIGTWTGIYDAPYWIEPGMYQGQMLELEAKHVAEFARHFADEPAILCWDLSDEPWYLEEIPPAPKRKADSLPPSRRDIATNWVSRLCSAIRDVDPNHLITLGCDPEPTRKDTGFALEEIAAHLDIMSYCIYPLPSYGIELDLISYGPFQTRFFATAGRPPFLHEGPGVSSSAACEEVIADRFRVWMYSSLANGTIGVLPWCYTDYEEKQHYTRPLNDKPQEPNFGICFADRTLKPRAHELLSFAKDVRSLPLDSLSIEPPRAALVYPCDFYQRADALHNKLWRHFAVAKGANLNIDLVREDFFPADMSLLIVPGFKLTLSAWDKLRSFVKSGGSVFFIMDEFFSLNPIFGELFGVAIEGLRPGPINAIFDPEWARNLDSPTLTFPANAERLRLAPTTAKTIAAFDDDYPLLLENSVEKGKAYLATFPFPLHLDLSQPQSETCLAALDIFKTIRNLAGCQPCVNTDLPWTETALFRSTAEDDDFALIINLDRTAGYGTASIPKQYSRVLDRDDKSLETTPSGDNLRIPIQLAPNGVLFWRLRR